MAAKITNKILKKMFIFFKKKVTVSNNIYSRGIQLKFMVVSQVIQVIKQSGQGIQVRAGLNCFTDK